MVAGRSGAAFAWQGGSSAVVQGVGSILTTICCSKVLRQARAARSRSDRGYCHAWMPRSNPHSTPPLGVRAKILRRW